MRRLVLVAVAGILALGAAAVVVIHLATSGSSTGPGGPPAETADAGAAQGPPGAVPPLPGSLPGAWPQLTPEQQAWAQVPALPAPLAQVVTAVAQPLAQCFDEEVQARFGPIPHTSLPDAVGPGPRPAMLMLQMEATDGALRVVDAPVAVLGNAGDGLVACAQQVLRGRTVPLGSLGYQPGERIAMSYELRPTVRPVAAVPSVADPASRDGGAPPPRPAFRRQRGKTSTPATP
jgi:hypothetical protein